MLTESVLPAIARATGIAVVAVLLAAGIRGGQSRIDGRGRVLLWTLLLLPWLTPSLLTAYAYLPLGLRLMPSPFALELFYDLLLLVHLLPVAVLVLMFCPSRLSGEALHCFHLLEDVRWRERAMFRVRAAGIAPWVAMALVFLLAFGEFDLASVLGIRTWSVALFDAQTGGMPLGETLGLAGLPACLSMAVVGVVLFLLVRTRPAIVAPPPVSRIPAVAVWAVAGAGFAIGTLWPVLSVAGQALAGVAALGRQTVLGRDLGVSVLFAGVSAGVAYLLAGGLVRRRAVWPWLAAAPGLAGSLVVALCVLALFHWSGLRGLYDGPLPLTVALVLLLMPFALLLRCLLRILEDGEALHVARLLGNARLVWELHSRKEAAVVFLLFCWAYFDVTASAILAPASFTPVFVRLHNLMHYGRSAVLSAMVIVSVLLPLALLGLTGGTAALYAHSRKPHG